MSRLSRRDFARVATVAAGAALLPRRARAQAADDAPSTTTTAPTNPAASATAPPPKLPPASQAEVDARVQAVVARWGPRLTARDRAAVAALAANLQAPLEAVRAASLDVTDEPAVVFRAARKPR